MTKKEKVQKVINREEQDYLPTQIDYTPEMGKIIRKLLKADEEADLDILLDNHIKYLPLSDIRKVDAEKGIKYDIWGIGWDLVLTEGFHIRYHPLIDKDNLFDYKIPEPKDDLLKNIKEQAPFYKDFFLASLQDFTLFERYWCLRGYENALTDFYLREKEAHYLLDGITEFHIEISKRIIKLGIVDGLRTGDDIGTQRGLMFSKDIWNRFFKKRYARIWDVYKDKSLPVIHHSCGNVLELIPDMIEMGLDVLNPIQPEAMAPEALAGLYSDELSFFGGISTQHTLPFESPEYLEKEIIDRIKVLGCNNGYIISPSHEITSDCKEENFIKLIETLDDYRNKRLNI